MNTSQNENQSPVTGGPVESGTGVRSPRIFKDIVENFEVVVFAVVAVLLIFAAGFRICYVSGTSMNNTLDDGDWVVTSGLGYEPQRGDIIVFHMTSKEHPKLNEPMVKRVIAVGGEWIDIDFNTWTVRIADNAEMNNAITIDEPYMHLYPNYATILSTYSYPLEVPEGYLFVMGDNRNGSLDSRDSHRVGLVDERRVLGKVLFRIYPFGKPIEN